MCIEATQCRNGCMERQLGRPRPADPPADESPAPAPLPPDGGPVLGMLLPSMAYYFMDILEGARDLVASRGGRLMVAFSDHRPERDPVQADRLIEGGAEALLLLPTWQHGRPEPGQGRWIEKLKVPVVLVERRVPVEDPLAGLDRVESNAAHGVIVAVEHLTSLGHRRILACFQTNADREQLTKGFAIAAEAFGLDRPQRPFVSLRQLDEEVRHQQILDRLCDAVVDDGVTAALIHTDADAHALVPPLRARGVRVPEDLALVSMGDRWAGFAEVPLTSVVIRGRVIGEAAARLLLDRARDSAPQHINYLPELVVRASSGSALP
ncbi:substrate-binding domain-containing protein [Streptomyces pathocidini]|uniref:LacI family DNA-binding transcriptional regulator n=1 Tax=Streptomyces pathocidini TaxID=1650571 RepID=UPI0033E29144